MYPGKRDPCNVYILLLFDCWELFEFRLSFWTPLGLAEKDYFQGPWSMILGGSWTQQQDYVRHASHRYKEPSFVYKQTQRKITAKVQQKIKQKHVALRVCRIFKRLFVRNLSPFS